MRGVRERCGLSLLSIVFCAWACNVAASTSEEKLLEWARAEGAELRVTIGQNAAGMRGLFAAEDIKENELLLKIPDNIILSIRRGPETDVAPHLLKEMLSNCSRFAPYLEALPKEGELLTALTLPIEYVRFLATDRVEKVVLEYRKNAAEAWNGISSDDMDLTVKQALSGADVSLETYKHAASLIMSRTIYDIRPSVWSLVPVADMVNHDTRSANAVHDAEEFDDNDLRLKAVRDIQKGEEILISYNDARPDILMVRYGIVDEIGEDNFTLRMCAVDHREFVSFSAADELALEEEFQGPPSDVTEDMERVQAYEKELVKRIEELGMPSVNNMTLAHMLISFQRNRRLGLIHENRRLEKLRVTALRKDLKKLKKLIKMQEEGKIPTGKKSKKKKKDKKAKESTKELPAEASNTEL